MRSGTERRLRREVARRAGVREGWAGLTSCAYCQQPIRIDWSEAVPTFRVLTGWDADDMAVWGEAAHLDHVIPECRNGPTSLDNTVLACPACNIAKGDSALGEPGFLEWVARRRGEKARRYAESRAAVVLEGMGL